MPTSREIEYAIKMTDLASSTIEQIRARMGELNKDLKKAEIGGQSFKAISSELGILQDKLGIASTMSGQFGNKTQTLTGFIKDQRQEQRMQNFLFSQGKDVVGAMAVGLSIFSNASGGADSSTKKLTDSLNVGYVTFQGLDFLLAGVAGPWGLAAAAAAGVGAAIFSMSKESEQGVQKLRDLGAQMNELQYSMGEISTESRRAFLMAEIPIAQAKIKSLKDTTFDFLALLDPTKYMRGMVFTQVGTPAEIEALEIAVKKLNKSIKDLEPLPGEANARKIREFMEMIDSVDSGSLGEMNYHLKTMQQELDALNPKSERYRLLLVQYNLITNQVKEAERNRSIQLQILNARIDEVFKPRAFPNYLKDILTWKPTALPEIPVPPSLGSIQNTIASITTQITDLYQGAGNADPMGFVKALKDAEAMENELSKIDSKMISSTQKAQMQWAKYSMVGKQALGAIQSLSSVQAENRIGEIEDEKDKRLNAIDIQLQSETLSEEQRAFLLKQRQKLEEDYNKKMADAKRAAWAADRDYRLTMAIIDTASAVVEALPNIPLSIIAGAMGAVQIAAIASQSPPRFHGGGMAYMNAPSSQEIPIMVRGQETVRVTTPEQEASGAGRTVVFNVNVYGPVADAAAFKRIVEKGMQDMGVDSPVKYFRNSRNKLVLSA
jgi:hypothetical protein